MTPHALLRLAKRYPTTTVLVVLALPFPFLLIAGAVLLGAMMDKERP